MKVCVYFNPNKQSEIYEGVRLIKNIKGALNLHGIPYAKNLNDSYDIAHFISLDDELAINEIKKRNIPVVFSALSCENDETAKILFEGELTLKAKRVLNKVDCILVADEASRKLLIEQGITTWIEVVSPGVNVSRFEFSESYKENIFYDYVRLNKEQKFVIFVSSKDDKKQRTTVINIAKKCPKINFFYIGAKKIRHHNIFRKSLPKNLKFYPLLSNELYCSMMKKTSAFVSVDNSNHSPITIIDASAGKTPIVAMKPLGLNKELLDNVGALIAENEIEVANYINSIVEGNVATNEEKGFEYAKENSLFKLGEQLIEIYKSLLDGR
ncbi:MAG: glycosyltransferase [Bacilli bacterium]|nr:glycosyltransferase [Bacilli bacterium]